MTNLQKVLAFNIKQTRKRLGLSQMALADQCSISPSFLGGIEIGRKFPSPANLESIARALGLEPYRLFMDTPKVPGAEVSQVLEQYTREIRSRFLQELDSLNQSYLT